MFCRSHRWVSAFWWWFSHCHVQLLAALWTVCNPPGSSVHGISQARILEWVPICFSRGRLPDPDKLCLLHWLADSLPLSHHWSPIDILLSFNWMVKNVEHIFMHLFVIYNFFVKSLFKYFVHFNWDVFLIIEFWEFFRNSFSYSFLLWFIAGFWI